MLQLVVLGSIELISAVMQSRVKSEYGDAVNVVATTLLKKNKVPDSMIPKSNILNPTKSKNFNETIVYLEKSHAPDVKLESENRVKHHKSRMNTIKVVIKLIAFMTIQAFSGSTVIGVLYMAFCIVGLAIDDFEIVDIVLNILTSRGIIQMVVATIIGIVLTLVVPIDIRWVNPVVYLSMLLVK